MFPGSVSRWFDGVWVINGANVTWCHGGYSFQASILSFMEQDAIYNAINFNFRPNDPCNCPTGGGTPANGNVPSCVVATMPAGTQREQATARNTVIEAFLCPSDPGDGAKRNNYGVNAGVWSGMDFVPLMGQMGSRSGFGSTHVRVAKRVRDIIDGTANTAAFSEHVVASARSNVIDKLTEVRGSTVTVPGTAGDGTTTRDLTVLTALQRDCLSGANAIDQRYTPSGSGSVWIYHRLIDNTIYNHGLPPNRAMCVPPGRGRPLRAGQVGGSLWSLRGPSSRHPGGVNVLMADGTVRFVSESVDLKTWMAIGTVAGGETIDNNLY